MSQSGPYGELITTTLRVLTWNVWGRFGPWQEREAALIGTLKALEPDVVALQETWCDRGGEDQRIDYILVGRPRRGGAGHVVGCAIAGGEPVDGVLPSDHYAVVADLRY